jgi:DNA-binding transcriptional ArsR family regulator
MRMIEYMLDGICKSAYMAYMKQIETFRILGDATRVRALVLIADQGALCVCELVAALELSQPKISRHLAALRDAGLVEARRDAQWVFYRISKTLPGWQSQAIEAALEGVADEPVLKLDRARLDKMSNRPQRNAAA